jgi:hypothetical protein
MTISLDDLDRCIRAIEETRARPVVMIYLNPLDWNDAKNTMKIISGSSYTPSNSIFGVPVILSSVLNRGQYIMEYNTMSGPQVVGWSQK